MTEDVCMSTGAIHQPVCTSHRRGVLTASHVHRLPDARSAPLDRRRHGKPRRRHHHAQGPDGLQPGGEAGTAAPARLQRRRRNAAPPAVRTHQAPHVIVVVDAITDGRRRRRVKATDCCCCCCCSQMRQSFTTAVFKLGSARGFRKVVIVCAVFNNLRPTCFQLTVCAKRSKHIHHTNIACLPL